MAGLSRAAGAGTGFCTTPAAGSQCSLHAIDGRADPRSPRCRAVAYLRNGIGRAGGVQGGWAEKYGDSSITLV